MNELDINMDGQPHSPPAQNARRLFLERERRVVALATRQHGVIARRQLLALGLGRGAIDSRVQSGRLHCLHRGIYALGHTHLSRRGRWLAAVLACGDGALLSHHTAAATWGLMRAPSSTVHVTASRGRPGRRGIALHRGCLHADDRTVVDAIPTTSVARTLIDLAAMVDRARLERAFEEADRLGLLELRAMEAACARGVGRSGVTACHRLIAEARAPLTTGSPLEERFAVFCREHHLPPPATNVLVHDFEVDALWPEQRLIVELDGFAFHHHRAAFERDRRLTRRYRPPATG